MIERVFVVKKEDETNFRYVVFYYNALSRRNYGVDMDPLPYRGDDTRICYNLTFRKPTEVSDFIRYLSHFRDMRVSVEV